MKLVLGLFLLLGLALSQVRLGSGEVLEVPCTANGHFLYFKTMQQFAIVSIDKVDGINLYSEHTNCSFNGSSSSICTFENFTKQVNVTCPANTNKGFHLSIQKPHPIGNQQEINTTFVAIPLNDGEQAILTLLMDYSMAQHVYSLGKNWKNIIYSSDCIKNMIPFQDQIRFALKKTNVTCTVGMASVNQWNLNKIQTSFKTLNTKTHKGYLQQNIPKKYELPDEDNITLTFIFETQNPQQIQNTQIKVTVKTSSGVIENFRVKNFEKGLHEGVQTRIFLNKSVEYIQFQSNSNLFYAFTFRNTNGKKLYINQNEYVYFYLQKEKEGEIIVELQTFEEQAEHTQVIYLHQQLNKSLKSSYRQCSTPDCANLTGSPIDITKNQFTPNCTSMIKSKCIILLNLKGRQTGYYGMILLAYNKEIPMEPNVVHTGILERERTYRYVIKKQHMINSTSQVIVINVKGAKAFLTYDPNCKVLSCTKYWDASGNIQIPKQNLDLFLYLVGTGHQHYTILISTKKSIHIKIPEGLLLKGRLSPTETRKYYIYEPIDASKSFQINCNALPGTVLLLMNIRNQNFPTKDNASFSSKDCYLHISPQQYSKQDKIHITIQRLTQQHKQINYNLIGISQGTQLSLEWGEPYYDYFQPSSQKVLRFFLGSPHNQDLSFKIDVFDQSFAKPLLIQVQGLQGDVELWNISVTNVQTFYLSLVDQKSICKNQKPGKCYLSVKILNNGEFGVEASITTWFKKQPLKLPIGEYTNFETGSLGQDTFLYIPVQDKTKALNVYAYSTQVQLEVLGMLYNQDTSILQSSKFWPFPRFGSLTPEQDKMMSYSFSSFLYFGAQQLQIAVPGSVILLTVRDRSTANNKSVEALSSLGIIQIAVSSGYLKIRQNDKFEYVLQKDSTYYFQFPLSGHHVKTKKLEVYFHNQALSGDSEIAYYFSNQKFQERHAIFQPTDFIVIKLDEYRKKYTVSQNDTIGIVFVVRTQTPMSKLVATVATSTTDYRQLTLGVPEQFYIPKHSTSIFQFADFYNQDFKIKIQREEGFPEYKIVSCAPKEDKIKCLGSLSLNSKVANKDDETLVVSGRTHQLKIDSKSEHYCKDCFYYIAFYSHDEEIFGSLTVTRPGQSVILRQSHPLTTEISSDDFDVYVVTSLPTVSRQVTIVPHMGQIRVQSYQLLQQNPENSVFNIQNSTDGSSINLHIQNTPTVIPFNIKVTSLNEENAMYSILLSSSSNITKLVNGIPFKIVFKTQSVITLQFAPNGKSTVLVSATDKVVIDLTCQSNSSAVMSKNKNVKHSQIFNTSLLHLNSSQCQIYQIQISNEKPLKLTVLANTQDIIMLPFGLVVPSIIRPNQTKIYEIPVQQKTHLKIVFKLCQSGHAHVAIYSSKQKLVKDKHNVTFEMSGDRTMEVFDYNASSGIIYLEVESSADVLQYTIEVYPIFRQSVERSTPRTLLNDTYIDTIQVSPKRFNIQFEPFKIIQNEINYSVNYVVIQSTQRSYLRKSLRCSGTFFDVKNPDTKFKETNLKVQKLPDGSFRAQYQTSQDRSYITIVPVITPPLPPFTHLVNYDISELSSGKGPQLVQRMISKMLAFIETISGIQDQNILNFSLIVIIMVFNVLLIAVCCWISARHCRKTVIIERKRLATSQREGRLTRVQNSLDMLDTVEEEPSQRQINAQ